MSHKFVLNANFHSLLQAIDHELADKITKAGCPCGGVLHRSNYPRSPAGLPKNLREYYRTRNSFCCNQCRKRITSPSVRFFGRRWVPAPLLILLSALTQGATEERCLKIKNLFGFVISPTTWKRWRRWWRIAFLKTRFWLQATGCIATADFGDPFPGALLQLFVGRLEEKLLSLLRFLAPITAGAFCAV